MAASDLSIGHQHHCHGQVGRVSRGIVSSVKAPFRSRKFTFDGNFGMGYIVADVLGKQFVSQGNIKLIIQRLLVSTRLPFPRPDHTGISSKVVERA